MSNKHFNDKGFSYVILAVICLIVFFVGYQLVIGPSTSMKNIFDFKFYSSEAPSNESEELDKYDKEIKLSKIDKFYLNSIIKSHSYFSYIYNDSLKEETNLKENLIKNIFSAKFYIKSQLPGILSLVDSIETSSDVVEENEYDDIQILDNINLVLSDSNLEYYKNDPNDTSHETEDIESKNFEDIIFIDPYEDNIDLIPNGNNINEETLKVLSKTIDKLEVIDNKPYIMVYHTHGQETYLESPEDNYHSTNRKYSVLKIGETLTKELEKKGHNLIYIDKYHDIPMKESYTNAYKTIKKQLDNNKNIKVLIDVHRDGMNDVYEAWLEEKGYKQSVNINGKEVATFSLVIGNGNSNRNELTKFAEYIKIVSDKMYPGLCSRIIARDHVRFNQSISDYSLLLEVGRNTNSIEESTASAKLIAEVLDKALKGIKD